jgi:uncharacterized glyoxalase superfamily protein PhnB
VAEQAVVFFKKAFRASESYRSTMSNGKIAHCEIRLGDSTDQFWGGDLLLAESTAINGEARGSVGTTIRDFPVTS